MQTVVFAPRLAAARTSHPVARRPKQVGALPQVIPLSATPTTGTLEGGAVGALALGLVGWAIGHFAAGMGKHGALIGAGVGLLAGGGVGYYEANNPTINVSPGGSYNVNVPANNGNLNINGPSSLTLTNAPAGGAISNATMFANGANSGNLNTGSNTITANWTDSSGNSQTATITANVS